VHDSRGVPKRLPSCVVNERLKEDHVSSGPLASVSGSREKPPTTLTWSDELGKRVRTGDWSDQAISTIEKIEEAVDAGQWEVAAQLVDYFMEEAKVVHVIYGVWFSGFSSFLVERGIPSDTISAELDRLGQLLRFPDGSTFDPDPAWDEVGAAAGRLATRMRAGKLTQESARSELDELRESWRQLHDRGADRIAGLLAFVAKTLGEPAIEDCYRFVLEPYVQERYMPFDTRVQPYEETLSRNLYLTFEAMRGHLAGPDRRGDMEVVELDDRWLINWQCGSGGRSMFGDVVEGTGSRVEEPYDFGVTQEEYPWAWNKKGVCYYCAHCMFACSLLPAERWGHPVRVIEPPTYPEAASGPTVATCKWTIFKSLEAIPDEAYEAMGRTKP
jgi:hypothetical protein